MLEIASWLTKHAPVCMCVQKWNTETEAELKVLASQTNTYTVEQSSLTFTKNLNFLLIATI